MALRFIMSAESHKLAASQYFHGFNQAGRLPLVIVMPTAPRINLRLRKGNSPGISLYLVRVRR